MKKFLVFFCAWFLGFTARTSAAGVVIIQLPGKATVAGPQISLGDIADVLGDDKAKADRIRRLALGKAAPAGDILKINPGYVKILLRREGYSLDEFEFQGSGSTEILTQSQSFDPAGLLPLAKAFVLDQTKETPEDVDVKIEGMGKQIILPAGKVTAKFRPSFSGRYEGAVFLTAELAVDGHLARTLPLRLEVDVFQPTVVVTKALEKGDKFTRDNVSLVRTPNSQITRGCLRQMNSVLGRTAASPLAPGRLVRVSDLYDPPAIQHGQIVEGIVQKGNIELSVQVRAIEDGKAGDSIRIENTESHRLLRGKVLDEKTVLIEPDDVKLKTEGAQ